MEIHGKVGDRRVSQVDRTPSFGRKKHMKTIDSIEFGVIEESTKIVVSRSLVIGNQSAQQSYCVVAEDMDKVNVSHVFEGMLFITGWRRLSTPRQAIHSIISTCACVQSEVVL